MNIAYLSVYLPLVAALFSLPWVIGYLLANYVIKKNSTLLSAVLLVLALVDTILVVASLIHPTNYTSILVGILNLTIASLVISHYKVSKLVQSKRIIFLLVFGTVTGAIGFAKSLL